MKRIFAAFACAVLVGCTPEPIPAPPPEVFRNTGAQIASQTDVTASRMAGNWVIRQSFANQPGPKGAMELSELPGGALQWSYGSGNCIGDVCVSVENLVLFTPSGPGRWTPENPEIAGFDEDIWVMWMDFDTRTAAIGTPSGEFGWIMDKNLTGGRDRITAARDIMEWFGYDMTRLNEVDR